ncbi:MAG: NUDIX domain-containing protein [Clostridia bacterium]|nr:NUDIX domain-containing protein [Clostridia bacterium]
MKTKRPELWDAYDKNFSPLGYDLVRGEPMPEGVYHIVSEVVVRHKDGDYLLMKRDPRKPVHPGKWELTAGGAALKGESPLDCIKRELFEETGITCCNFVETDRLRFRWSDFGVFFFEYFAVTDCPKTSVRLQKGETVAYFWAPKKRVLEMFENSLIIPDLKNRHKKFFASPDFI